MVLAGFLMTRYRPWTYFMSQEIVYAYFEVRALDPSGRPIAGALVKNGGKKVGTTDSFGEWRRYMKVPLGATVPVTIAKKTQDNLLFATKNFAVPPEKPEKSDIELRGSVQLQIVDRNDLSAKSAIMLSGSEPARAPGSAQTSEREISNADLMTTTVGDGTKDRSAGQPTAERLGSSTPPELASASNSEFQSTHESVWFEVNSSQASTLSRDVLPALKKRAAQLGLRLDPNAKWRVRLSSLIEKPERMDKDGGGLIQISSFDGEKNGVSREFLRAYSKDSLQTAKGILFLLAHHVTKNVWVKRVGERWVAMVPGSTADLWKLSAGIEIAGEAGVFALDAEPYVDGHFSGFYLTKTDRDPCVKNIFGCELMTRSFGQVPPVSSWSRHRLKLSSGFKEPLKVFVSGYEAEMVGDKIYEYWGLGQSRANLTVVQAGRVALRSQIVNDRNTVSVVGMANISRR
jgi:hypothetical protein